MLIVFANAGSDRWKNTKMISEGTTVIIGSKLV